MRSVAVVVASALLATFAVAAPAAPCPKGSATTASSAAAGSPTTKPARSGKFLHVTDIHVDPTYLEGSDPLQLCHRLNTADATQNTAGRFGTLGSQCDSPLLLVDAAFDFMKTNAVTKDVDFIIYTGDTARHDRDVVVPRTAEIVLSDHGRVIDYFAKTFDLSKVTLYPTLGNNDAFVHDMLDGPSSSPLIGNLTKIWKPLGLGLDTDNDFQRGGYYEREIAPGQHIISLNSFWLYSKNKLTTDCNNTSSAGAMMLSWFSDKLAKFKEAGASTYVIAHIPPRDEYNSKAYYDNCYSSYKDIVVKYASTIRSHFHGHTNMDTLSYITTDTNTGASHMSVVTYVPSKPLDVVNDTNIVVSVFTNGPSIIPVNNPAVRVYKYDTDASNFGALLDYTQFYTDLVADNNNGVVAWDTAYSAAQTYGLTDLSQKSLSALVQDLLSPSSTYRAVYDKFFTELGPKVKAKKA